MSLVQTPGAESWWNSFLNGPAWGLMTNIIGGFQDVLAFTIHILFDITEHIIAWTVPVIGNILNTLGFSNVTSALTNFLNTTTANPQLQAFWAGVKQMMEVFASATIGSTLFDQTIAFVIPLFFLCLATRFTLIIWSKIWSGT